MKSALVYSIVHDSFCYIISGYSVPPIMITNKSLVCPHRFLPQPLYLFHISSPLLICSLYVCFYIFPLYSSVLCMCAFIFLVFSCLLWFFLFHALIKYMVSLFILDSFLLYNTSRVHSHSQK